VSDLISEWQQATGKTFSVCGQTFAEFVKKCYSEYTADKENEKILRVSSKLLCISVSPCDVMFVNDTLTTDIDKYMLCPNHFSFRCSSVF